MRNPEAIKKRYLDKRFVFRKLREGIAALFVLAVFGYMMISCSTEVPKKTEKAPVPTPTATLVEIDPSLDFTKFKHENAQHERLPCAYCHVRQDNSTTPKFPVHTNCAGCHVEQFADKQNGICTVCHTEVDNAALKRFPGLSNFSASFDHARHLKQANCADCHKSIGNGAAMSIPTRAGSHASCFQCHTPEKEIGGKNIGSCQTCHSQGRPPTAVSATSPAFARAFKHSNHTMGCTSCHNVRSGSGRGKQVGAITAKMHFPPRGQSCATCHNNKRAFGGDDFSDCKRCHQQGVFTFP